MIYKPLLLWLANRLSEKDRQNFQTYPCREADANGNPENRSFWLGPYLLVVLGSTLPKENTRGPLIVQLTQCMS